MHFGAVFLAMNVRYPQPYPVGSYECAVHPPITSVQPPSLPCTTIHFPHHQTTLTITPSRVSDTTRLVRHHLPLFGRTALAQSTALLKHTIISSVFPRTKEK